MRIALFTETFLPKIDGVVNTLCHLLEHLQLGGRAHGSSFARPASNRHWKVSFLRPSVDATTTTWTNLADCTAGTPWPSPVCSTYTPWNPDSVSIHLLRKAYLGHPGFVTQP